MESCGGKEILYPHIFKDSDNNDEKSKSTSAALDFEKNWTLRSIARVERKLNNNNDGIPSLNRKPTNASSSAKESIKGGRQLNEIAKSLEGVISKTELPTFNSNFTIPNPKSSLHEERIKIHSSSDIEFSQESDIVGKDKIGLQIDEIDYANKDLYSSSISSKCLLIGKEYSESQVEMSGRLWKKSLLGWRNIKVVAKSRQSRPGILCLLKDEADPIPYKIIDLSNCVSVEPVGKTNFSLKMRKFDIDFSCKDIDLTIKWVETIRRLLGTVVIPHVEEIEKQLWREIDRSSSLNQELIEMKSLISMKEEQLRSSQARENSLNLEVKNQRKEIERLQIWQTEVLLTEKEKSMKDNGKIEKLSDSLAENFHLLTSEVKSIKPEVIKSISNLENTVKQNISNQLNTVSKKLDDVQRKITSSDAKQNSENIFKGIQEIYEKLEEISQRVSYYTVNVTENDNELSEFESDLSKKEEERLESLKDKVKEESKLLSDIEQQYSLLMRRKRTLIEEISSLESFFQTFSKLKSYFCDEDDEDKGPKRNHETTFIMKKD